MVSEEQKLDPNRCLGSGEEWRWRPWLLMKAISFTLRILDMEEGWSAGFPRELNSLGF